MLVFFFITLITDISDANSLLPNYYEYKLGCGSLCYQEHVSEAG